MNNKKTRKIVCKKIKNDRPSFDEYFMDIAHLVCKRSTCIRRKVGAVLVKDNRIISTGYNGAPAGLKHCLDIGCMREKLGIPSGERLELCRGVHAEQNAIAHAARFGIPTENTILYITLLPCVTCAKMIIDAGIKEIVYENEYPDTLANELLKESKIKVRMYTTQHKI